MTALGWAALIAGVIVALLALLALIVGAVAGGADRDRSRAALDRMVAMDDQERLAAAARRLREAERYARATLDAQAEAARQDRGAA